MKSYEFTLTGNNPLLMHADDIEQSDLVDKWLADPENKKLSKAGDDRTPVWKWQTYLYSDGEHIAMPSDNIMVALRTGATKIQLKGNKTFKEASQNGMMITETHCDFFVDGKQIAMSDVLKMKNKPFTDQCDAARKLGFTLFGKRARVGQSKHIRVRPKFDKWTVKGSVQVWDGAITKPILEQMFSYAGFAGLCDWRPSSKTPGPYGMFEVKIK